MNNEAFTTPGQPSSGVVFIICPYIIKGPHKQISPEARLEEAVGLARAIQLCVMGSDLLLLITIRPATYLSKGHVEDFQGIIKELKADVVFIDAPISPIQQRNLEKAWQCKVIDRTGLILEIFGARARTAEGRLQVELAALTYQKSRLVRSWTHLERQRGGFGFTGGPGETQLELDRRIIGTRIKKIKKELEEVKRTRALHREARRRIPYPIVALVGYTNAGKSTLFNQLTRADVMAEDILFATLDPTMRKLELPLGREIILSDTVGFISELPTLLVAAFRATLEEVVGADVILHVEDISHPEAEAHHKDVLSILEELGLKDAYEDHGISVLNKCDLLSKGEYRRLQAQAKRAQHPYECLISAQSGEGLSELLERIDQILSRHDKEVTYTFPISEGKKIAWLYDHGEVLARMDGEETIELTVKLSAKDQERFEQL